VQDNRKTRYTRAALGQAMIETLKDKPLARVTVTELCRRADLSRGTFYLHYDSPADVLDDLEDRLLADFTEPWRDRADIDDPEFILTVLRRLATDPGLAALVAQPNSTLVERFFAWRRDATHDACRAAYPDLDEAQLSYVRTYKEQGAIHLIADWVRRGMPEPADLVAALLARLT